MLYQLLKPPAKIVIDIVWRPVVRGLHHVPASGPVILASNHLALCETIIMPTQLSRVVHFLGKSDFFAGGSTIKRLFGWAMRQLEVMPVDRSGATASASAIEAGCAVLRAGKILGIYPEGTRSPDGRLYRGKTGAMRMALATDSPVVPIAMLGTFEAQKGRRIFPRRHPRIHVLFGEAYRPSERAAELRAEGMDEATVLRVLTDDLMARIQEMSQQEQVDEYASEVKKRLRKAAGTDHLPEPLL